MPLQPGQTPAQIAAAHHIDDMEKLRVHPLKAFQNIDLLLDDALAAIGNGHYSTAHEFIERARDAGKKELEWLRSQRN